MVHQSPRPQNVSDQPQTLELTIDIPADASDEEEVKLVRELTLKASSYLRAEFNGTYGGRGEGFIF